MVLLCLKDQLFVESEELRMFERIAITVTIAVACDLEMMATDELHNDNHECSGFLLCPKSRAGILPIIVGRRQSLVLSAANHGGVLFHVTTTQEHRAARTIQSEVFWHRWHTITCEIQKLRASDILTSKCSVIF